MDNSSVTLSHILRRKALAFGIQVGIPLLLVCAFAVHAEAATPTDIASSPNQQAILALYAKGVITGYADGTFQPNGSVNRAELAKIIVTALGVNVTTDATEQNCFPDVTNQWFAPYVCYAKAQGWVSGYSDGTFRPSDPVNTAEAIKMILNSQGIDTSSASSASGTSYTDVDQSAWYAAFVNAASSRGLLQQTRGTLGINANINRGGVAEIIYRALTIKASGAARFDAGTEEQSSGQGHSHSGRGGMMQQNLQQYLDQAKAATDLTQMTESQFTSAIQTQMEAQMQARQQAGQGSSWSFSGGQHSFGGAGSSGGMQSRLAQATTFESYTDTTGTTVYLAIDANGNVLMKWPMSFGGRRGMRGGSSSSSVSS